MKLSRGFTLLEVLVAIAIIGLLAALIVPQLATTSYKAQQAVLRVAFDNLGFGLDQFKERFGVYPPSSITLREDASTYTAAEQAILRRIWPRFDFTTTSDFDSGSATVYPLNGAQCVVFFLGGMPDAATHTGTGFSKSQSNPFQAQASAADLAQRDRFHDFQPDDLVLLDSSQQANADSRALFYAMADPLSDDQPIAYFSDFPGVGYDSAHNSFASFYHKGAASNPWAPGGYQLISAGVDEDFGDGGAFYPYKPTLSALQSAEEDNLTSFHDTMLGVEQQRE
jgi:prepilin-type N-terminal cleavage/methylation domain-containing protein